MVGLISTQIDQTIGQRIQETFYGIQHRSAALRGKAAARPGVSKTAQTPFRLIAMVYDSRVRQLYAKLQALQYTHCTGDEKYDNAKRKKHLYHGEHFCQPRQ